MFTRVRTENKSVYQEQSLYFKPEQHLWRGSRYSKNTKYISSTAVCSNVQIRLVFEQPASKPIAFRTNLVIIQSKIVALALLLD
jgi:hypothetical protein